MSRENAKFISVRTMTEGKEVEEQLIIPEEEYEQLFRKYGIGRVSERKHVSHKEAFERAKAAEFPEEELKGKNFRRDNAGEFEKAVMLLGRWSEMIQKELFKSRKLRIEINYDMEAKETDFAIYTPEGKVE